MIAISSAVTAAGKLPGDECQWTLEFRTGLEQPGPDRPIEISLSGDWVSTVSAVRPGEYDVALELSGAHIKGDGFPSIPPIAIAQVEQRLARRFWATYRNDGALVALHFYKDADPSDRNLLQMIASETQFVRAGPREMVWTVLERDGAGSYLAIYNRDDFKSAVKRKLKYVAADGETGVPFGGFLIEVDQSALRFRLDPAGEIASLDANNRMRIGIPLSDQPPLIVSTSTHLANLRRSRGPERIGSLARAAADVVTEPIVTHRSSAEQLQVRLDERLLEGRTAKSLLDSAVAKDDQDPKLPERLTALLRRDPEAAAAAETLLRHNGPLTRITNALGSAATPATIQTLGNIALDSSLAVALRIDALNALVRVHKPSPDTMRIPVALLGSENSEILSAARRMSGALARAGRSGHPSEADAIDAALIAHYRKARDIRETCDLLAALGNSAGPAVLPLIEDALRDPRVSVRAAAARELRLAEAPEIDGLLSAAITKDADPQVRTAAIFAASFRPLSAALVDSLQRAARGDEVDYVRRSAVSLLREHSNAAPDIRDTLAWVAENDANSGVRRLAQEALATVPHQAR